IEKLVNDLGRRGINKDRLFEMHFRGEERIALWKIETDDGDVYRFEDEGWTDLLPEDSDEQVRQMTLPELAEDSELHEVRVERMSEMAEIREIDTIIDGLAALNIVPSDFLSIGTDGANIDSVFTLTQGNREPKRAKNVWELFDHIIAVGRQGINIIRYKGLAEMQWDQLRETTLDPEKRTLIQVKLEDAVEADRMFTVLMSNDVAPRRALIERYGQHVNLDLYGA
ncbi:MAG: DNA gyrase subunit B, partial [Candidatus Poribacteria bacterium]|nr:DNA gyrase subunit B [Candidatus Poribacteria bacterium]